MPNHKPEHIARITVLSAAQRRADKIANLIESAPPLSPEQVDRLRQLLFGLRASSASASSRAGDSAGDIDTSTAEKSAT